MGRRQICCGVIQMTVLGGGSAPAAVGTYGAQISPRSSAIAMASPKSQEPTS
jgi:hypothetical protein